MSTGRLVFAERISGAGAEQYGGRRDGEFGVTPKINPADGRDTGRSAGPMLMGGGPLKGESTVVGEQ